MHACLLPARLAHKDSNIEMYVQVRHADEDGLSDEESEASASSGASDSDEDFYAGVRS